METGDGKKVKSPIITNYLVRACIPLTVVKFQDYNTETKVHFEITVPDLHKMTDAVPPSSNRIQIMLLTFQEIEDKFNLVSTVKISNMHFFSAEGKFSIFLLYLISGTIKKYHSAEQILRDFYTLRMIVYAQRKVVSFFCLRS